MRISSILATGAALALLLTPAAAPARGPKHDDHPGNGQAKAYGKLCQGLSKEHEKGQKGTPFSRCVKAGRKLEDQRLSDSDYGDDSYADPFGDD